MATWSQHARYAQLPKQEKGMGGGGGYPYNNAFQSEISLTANPQRILVIDKGEYSSYNDPSDNTIKLPYWERARHSFADQRQGRRYFRSYLCPKTHKGDRNTPCRSCTMQWDESDPRLQTRFVKYVPVISLEWWYTTTNKYGDEKFELPQSPAEERRLQNAGADRVFGRAGYLALGNGHFGQLMDIADSIAKQCTNCFDPSTKPAKLHPAAYHCGACDQVLEDLETTELTGDELKSFPYRKHTCSVCNATVHPRVQFECTACDDPKPAEIFDVVLPLCKRGENTQSMVSVPHGEEITFIDQTHLSDEIGVLFNGEEFNPAVAHMYEALDFNAIFEVELREDYQDRRVF